MNATSAIAARKMHGAENTFVVLDTRAEATLPSSTAGAGPKALSELAKVLCAPRGPMDGADGLLVIGDAPRGRARDAHDGKARAIAEMRIFNADGSEAEMCGNGVRCVARYLWERDAGDAFTIATLAGAIGVEIVRDAPFAARLDMGPVRFPNGAQPERFSALGTTWTYYDVSLGNPHAVAFVDDASDAGAGAIDEIDLDALGRAAQTDARFPAGTNLHLVATLAPNHLRVRHFERGVGLTRACGTGAVAAATAAIAVRGAVSPIAVDVPGGRLDVAWRAGENACLTGPAETLFARTLAL